MPNPESIDPTRPESRSEGEVRTVAKKRGKEVLSAVERTKLEEERAKILERIEKRQIEISAIEQSIIDEEKTEEDYIIPTSEPEPEPTESSQTPESEPTNPGEIASSEPESTSPEGTSSPEPESANPEGTSPSETQSSANTAAPESETTHRAKIEYVKKESNKNVAFRNFMSGVAVIAAASVLGASIPTNGFGLLDKDKDSQSVPTNPTAVGQTVETPPSSSDTIVITTPSPEESTSSEQSQETPAASAEDAESKKGIKDGYGAPGLWLSENKDHDYDYGDAKEVGDICDHDEVEMLKYAADNQVESLADYMAEFPEDLCPEGFYGLEPREIEKKLENLSPDEYEKVKAQAMHALDEAFTRTTVTKRSYHHYGMQLKDKDGEVIHENMQLIDEGIGPDVEVVEFYWVDKDGNETGSMLVNIRRTTANERGEVNGHEGGLEVLRVGETNPTTPPVKPTPEPTPTPTPEPTPTPTPEPTPTPTPEPTPTPLEQKDPDEEIEHAGPRASVQEQTGPQTSLEQDQEGFAAMEQQKSEDEARADEAAKIATEQAIKEQLAGEQAATRTQPTETEPERQQQADEAAEQATGQAAARQGEATQGERERAQEEAERERAQQQADQAAAENTGEGDANAGASASERAGIDY